MIRLFKDFFLFYKKIKSVRNLKKRERNVGINKMGMETKEGRVGLKKQKTVQEQIKAEGNKGEIFYWMKAHLFWHCMLPASSNLDTFIHIDLILICSVRSCTRVHSHIHIH